MEDVLNIARAFKNDDPDGNGQDDTLGMRLDETYMSQKAYFGVFMPIRISGLPRKTVLLTMEQYSPRSRTA